MYQPSNYCARAYETLGQKSLETTVLEQNRYSTSIERVLVYIESV